MLRVVCWMLPLLMACDARERIAPEPPLPRGLPNAPSSAAVAEPPPEAAAPRPLPILGDPHGLLSKQTKAAPAQAPNAKLDPGALRGEVLPPTPVQFERDPRAVERGRSEDQRRPTPLGSSAEMPVNARPVEIKERSADEVLRPIRMGAGGPHVLFLYASYCKACRGVMPSFLEIVRTYRARGVRFTAASIDRNPMAFAEYAPVLGGLLEPLWIRPEGSTGDELKRAGIDLGEGGLAIPFFALFESPRHVVAQGYSRELRSLPQAIDRLL